MNPLQFPQKLLLAKPCLRCGCQIFFIEVQYTVFWNTKTWFSVVYKQTLNVSEPFHDYTVIFIIYFYILWYYHYYYYHLSLFNLNVVQCLHRQCLLLHDDWNHVNSLKLLPKIYCSNIIDGMVLRALHELTAPSAGQLKAFKWFKAPNASGFSAETCYSTRWRFMNGGEYLRLLVLS